MSTVHVPTLMCCIPHNGRKLSRILHFCGNSRKFSPRKSVFKRLDTALVGVVTGLLQIRKKVFSAKSISKQFVEVFSCYDYKETHCCTKCNYIHVGVGTILLLEAKLCIKVMPLIQIDMYCCWNSKGWGAMAPWRLFLRLYFKV